MTIFNPHTLVKFLLLVLILVGPRNSSCASQEIAVAHLGLNRRGGALAQHSHANLTHLVKLLDNVERRYARAKREVKGNKLVRRWRARSTGTTNDEQLLGEPGQEGSWYVNRYCSVHFEWQLNLTRVVNSGIQTFL